MFIQTFWRLVAVVFIDCLASKSITLCFYRYILNAKYQRKDLILWLSESSPKSRLAGWQLHKAATVNAERH